MAYPTTFRSFRRSKGSYPHTVEPSTESLPESLGPYDVVIRIHAVSLNYRDIAMLREENYPVYVIDGGIAASDCAAEVVAVGSKVKLEIGEHVAPIFDLANLTGTEREGMKALGGDIEGVLAEYAVFEEKYLVTLPRYLSWEQASTVVCAGVTAWSSFSKLRDLKEGSFALLEGTGGVSMFGLLICLAAGIKPIITSSSNEKIENVKKLSPEIEGINYKEHKDIAAEVLRLTNGKGVDFVVNNAGPGSIPSNIKGLRRFGTISLVGFLNGVLSDTPPDTFLQLLMKTAKIQGIGVGSKLDFEQLNKFLEDNKVDLEPAIDHKVFAFDDSPAAFEYLASGKHTGKVVIKF